MGSMLTAEAQLINPSFEQTDSIGAISDWKLTQGKISRYSVINLGVIPFTASNGNYFILLESDTSTLPVKKALFEQQYALSDTPGSMYMDYLYIPENTSQHAEITLFFSKWNGSQRDTILFKTDTIPVIANGSIIPIQWNTYSANLKDLYKQVILPDTAWIRLSNTDNPGKNIKLFADNISFSKWTVGLTEPETNLVNIFPNPASDRLTIFTNGTAKPDRFLLVDITGKQFAIEAYTISADQYSISVNKVPDGLYSFVMMSNNTPLHRKLILVKH
jgi:hypothetical protein